MTEESTACGHWESSSLGRHPQFVSPRSGPEGTGSSRVPSRGSGPVSHGEGARSPGAARRVWKGRTSPVRRGARPVCPVTLQTWVPFVGSVGLFPPETRARCRPDAQGAWGGPGLGSGTGRLRTPGIEPSRRRGLGRERKGRERSSSRGLPSLLGPGGFLRLVGDLVVYHRLVCV